MNEKDGGKSAPPAYLAYQNADSWPAAYFAMSAQPFLYQFLVNSYFGEISTMYRFYFDLAGKSNFIFPSSSKFNSGVSRFFFAFLGGYATIANMIPCIRRHVQR